jgi:hypothetical protein
MARVGFLSIAACTFGLSFDAISEVAQQTGAVDPALAWIVPFAVDGMIVTATAVLWTESLSGQGWHMFPLLAIIGPAALSMWANISHRSAGRHVRPSHDDVPDAETVAPPAHSALPAQAEARRAQLASKLDVPRSRVQRAIERNRDEWEELRGRVRRDKALASAGAPGDRR